MNVEPCCLNLLFNLLPSIDEEKKGVCIEIGVGTFAFYCEMFADQGFTTVAVEPLPVDNLKNLCGKLGINLIESCVSDVNGIQTLYIGNFQGLENLNLSSLNPDWWGASSQTKEVFSLTLLELLTQINAKNITCLKIDVEGSELTIIKQLQELSPLLLPKVIMFEYGGGDSKQSNSKGWNNKFLNATKDCLKVLKSCQYNFSILIDAEESAEVIFLNLQTIDIDNDPIFMSTAQWGNIISFRGYQVNLDEIAKLCVPFRQTSVKNPVITMSTLGTNGGFGNQVFQYAFLKIYSQKHDLHLETSSWIGQYLFGAQDAPITQKLPQLDAIYNSFSKPIIANETQIFHSVDFWGFFLDHTGYYAPYKNYFCSLFEPIPELKTQLDLAWKKLCSQGKTIVALHLRRGDFGYGYFFIAPNEWYQDWLESFWDTLDDPILYIASDEPDKVVKYFAQYNPITAQDLDVIIPEAPFYVDFWLLSQADIVAISNSSFSFAACLLNNRGKLFLRPHLFAERLIPFDPWSSEIVLKDETVEEYLVRRFNDNKINIAIFPDWQQSEETLYQDLSNAINLIIDNPQNEKLRLLILISEIPEEEAHLIIADVIMTVLLEAELNNLIQEPAIETIHWVKDLNNLLDIKGRIALSKENQTLVNKANIPVIDLDSLTNKFFSRGDLHRE